MNPANGIVANGIPCAEARGTADAITADFNPPVIELKNGLKVSVQALSANTSTEPYFQIGNFEAFPIVKGVNQPLIAGDIAGAGHWLDLQFNGLLNKWVLQNPALGVTCPSGVPIGAVGYFAMQTPPPGYLKADGSAVSRDTYPDLFAAIGTTFGGGNGSSTFNLPNLMGCFAQGATTVGQRINAGLPNIEGTIGGLLMSNWQAHTGAFSVLGESYNNYNGGNGLAGSYAFRASASNPIYGASTTVQPPAVTLLPCIKAYDAIPVVAQVDTLALASEVTAKANRADVEPYLSKAWVNFDASSGTVVIKNAKNIQGVVRVEKGIFDIIFDNAMESDTFTVMASSSALVTAVNRESMSGPYYRPTADRVRVVTGSAYPPAAEDASDVNVIVLC